MYGLSEASAVHLRIENDKGEGKQGKEALENHGGSGGCSSPYAGDERCSDDGFRKGEEGSEGLCRKTEEAYVQEVEIFVHDEARPDRIDELEDAGDEEYETCYEAAEASESFDNVFHVVGISELSV